MWGMRFGKYRRFSEFYEVLEEHSKKAVDSGPNKMNNLDMFRTNEHENDNQKNTKNANMMLIDDTEKQNFNIIRDQTRFQTNNKEIIDSKDLATTGNKRIQIFKEKDDITLKKSVFSQANFLSANTK